MRGYLVLDCALEIFAAKHVGFRVLDSTGRQNGVLVEPA